MSSSEGVLRRCAAVAGTACAVLIAAFAVPAPAAADDGPLPWAGGTGVVTPFEAQAAAIASDIAGRPVRTICNSAADWASLAADGGFDPDRVLGYVLFATTDGVSYSPLDYAHLSEQPCRDANAFWRDGSPAKSSKSCPGGTRTEYRTEYRTQSYRARVAKRVRVKGKWVVRRVWVTRTRDVPVQVPVQVPVAGECAEDAGGRLLAIQTLAHESVHLRGVMDEAITECLGMQLFGYTARRLAAPADLARQLAGDYWTAYYSVYRPGTGYFSPECRDGGALDLAPGSAVWPDGFDSDAAALGAIRSAADRYA